MLHGAFNRRRRVVQAEAVPQHQRGGQNLRDGIGQIFAGNIRRGAAGGFVETERLIAIRRAQACARQHSERTAQRRRFVAQDVTEHVFAQHHVELRGLEHELHRAVVHEHVIQRHIGIIFADARDDFAPQNAVLQHVRLVNARQFLPAQLRGLERDVRDALDFRRGINHRVNRAKIAAAEVFGFFRLAEIHAAGQFAHDQNINAVALPFLRERTGVRKNFRQLHRAQVGEQTKFLPQPQQRGAFRSFFFRNRRIAVRQADGTEENRVGLFADVERDVRQCFFGEVNAGPTDGRVGDVQLELETFFRGAQNLDGFAHDFRADAVARERCDVVSVHEK